jgi:sugar transferase (PEP-CTERM/EpsH1 system associated)
VNILYLTHRVPYPPNRGDRIRSYHTLRFLAARAKVDLACLADEPVTNECRAVLRELCDEVAIVPVGRKQRWVRAIASLASGRSATEGLFWSPELSRVVEQWSSGTRYDAVLIYCSSMGPYLAHVCQPRTNCLVDLVDVDSQKWFDYAERCFGPKRWLYRLEGRRVRQIEKDLARRSQGITVVSANEACLLQSICPQAPVTAVCNGVDCEYFQPTSVSDPECQQRMGEKGGVSCAFVGALDYRANVDGITWFCREVWSQVCQQVPTAKLTLVGHRPTISVRQLARHPNIEIVADAPDVRPYLSDASVVVVPLRIARGIQNKVLEALAAGKPVIASRQALDGLDVVDGEHVYQADSATDWMNRIRNLFQDSAERRRLGAAGREFVLRHHIWEACLQPLVELLGLGSSHGVRQVDISDRTAVHAE